MFDHNLHLIARAISYTTEAAVVFGDNVEANELLALIASNEEVAEAKIIDKHNRQIAYWALPDDGPIHHMEQIVARWILPAPVVLPMFHAGDEIGKIVIVGAWRQLIAFLATRSGGDVGVPDGQYIGRTFPITADVAWYCWLA